MKKITVIILLHFAICTFTFAQQLNWGAFSYVFDAKPYAGKMFKIEAAAKVKLIDSSANAEIWVRVDKKNKKLGFFNNMTDKPIRSSAWKVYSQTGRIDKEAEKLVFGGLYHNKGIFWFDDFKLFIKNNNGDFQAVPLSAASFEEDTSFINQHWFYSRNTKGFILSKSDEAYQGKYSYKADGSSLVYAKQYGENSDAGRYAIVNGIKIYFETYGEGEPLLLLHGNRSSISLFQKQIPALDKHFKVIAIDSRGQGKSLEDGKRYSYDLFAEDMNALLDYLKLDSVNIIGWSDGGNTGLIMAMKYPKKVKRLVTMGANIFIDKTVVEKSVFKEINKKLREFGQDTSAKSKNQYRLVDLLQREPNHSFEELKTIKCPVLVMAGEEDLIKEAHTKSIAANIPNSTLMIVPKATHDFPSDDPAAFNRIVIDFLEKK